MADRINTPTLLPDPDRINRMVNDAINLLGAAALGAAGLLLQDELSDGPPNTVPTDAKAEWRSSKQRTLGELRSQVMHADRDDGEVNQTVVSEAFAAFVHSIPDLVQEAAEAAITQAWIVASVERGRIEEAINPRPPAPGLSTVEQARVKVGNAIWEAGDHLGAVAERCGLLVGKALRTPLQRISGWIVGEVEL